jgi:hypothetical protein
MKWDEPGFVLTIDEKGEPYEAVCEYSCTHRVTPVTRFQVTVVEARKVRDFFTEGWGHGGRPGPATATGRRAVDADGTEWTQDWDGLHGDRPGDWRTADGRRASTATAADPRKVYAGGRSSGFTFTDLTRQAAPGQDRA